MLGIIDSHGLMAALQADIEEAGGIVSLRTPVTSIEKEETGFVLGLAEETISAGCVVNSAGLWADYVGRLLSGSPKLPPLYPCKGQYYSYAGQSLCTHLIYPSTHNFTLQSRKPTYRDSGSTPL